MGTFVLIPTQPTLKRENESDSIDLMAGLLQYVGRFLWSFLGFSGAEREKSISQDFPVDFRRARRHITDAAFVLAPVSHLIGLREAPNEYRSRPDLYPLPIQTAPITRVVSRPEGASEPWCAPA